MLSSILKKTSLFLLATSHFTFIVAIVIERNSSILIWSFGSIMCLLLAFAYYKLPQEEKVLDFAPFSQIAMVLIGALSTFFLCDYLDWNEIFAAASVGLFASFIPNLSSENKALKQIPNAIYCGTFVGMTALQTSYNYIFIAIASVFAGCLLIGNTHTFRGYGGKLGSLAFGGVGIAFCLFYILGQWN